MNRINELRDVIRTLLREDDEKIYVSKDNKNGPRYRASYSGGKYTLVNVANPNDTISNIGDSTFASKYEEAPAGATSAETPPKKGGGKSTRPAGETGFAKLHSTLASIYAANRAAIDPLLTKNQVFPYMGGSIKGDKVADQFLKISSGDEATAATRGMLYGVCKFLGNKIVKEGEGFWGKMKSIVGADINEAQKEKIFNEPGWKELLSSLTESDKKKIAVEITTPYLLKVTNQNISFTRDANGFADYLLLLAQNSDVNVQAAPEAQASAAAAAELSNFLAGVYSDDADAEITADVGLTGAAKDVFNKLVDQLQKASGNVIAYEFAKESIKAAISDLAVLKVKIGTREIVSNFKNPTIAGYQFPADEAGLVQFLKLALVATREASRSGLEMATKLGTGAPTSDNLFGESELWSCLGLSGVIEIFPIVAVQNKTGANIEPGYILTCDISGELNKFKTEQSVQPIKPDGFSILAIGYTYGKKISYSGFDLYVTYNQIESERIAKKIIAGSGNISATISVGDNEYKGSASINKMGTRVQVAPDVAAGSTPAPGAAAPKSDITMPTRLIKNTLTQEGEAPPFVLQNPYRDSRNARQLNSPDVSLVKDVEKNFDSFKLTVVDQDTDAILVPIRLRIPLREANRRWEEPILQGMMPVGEGTDNVAYMAFRQISWTYGNNYVSYGIGTPRILPDRTSYVPSPENYRPPGGISLISVEDAITQGETGTITDPVRTAIARYINDTNNPVGEALYMQNNLNAAMNKFDVFTRFSGGMPR